MDQSAVHSLCDAVSTIVDFVDKEAAPDPSSLERFRTTLGNDVEAEAAAGLRELGILRDTLTKDDRVLGGRR